MGFDTWILLSNHSVCGNPTGRKFVIVFWQHYKFGTILLSGLCANAPMHMLPRFNIYVWRQMFGANYASNFLLFPQRKFSTFSFVNAIVAFIFSPPSLLFDALSFRFRHHLFLKTKKRVHKNVGSNTSLILFLAFRISNSYQIFFSSTQDDRIL